VALDLPNAMLGLGQSLILDLADHRLAGLGHRQAGDALELDQLSLPQLVQPGGLDLEALGSGVERRCLVFERGRLTIERLLPIQESALGALVSGALLARLFLGRATQVQSLVLPFEDDLLLLCARLGLEALRVPLGVLDRVGGDEATRHEAEEHPDDGGNGRHGDDSEFGHRLLLVVGARIGRGWRPRGGRSIGTSCAANPGRKARV